MYMVQHLKALYKLVGDYALYIIYLNALNLKDARVLQSCISEGSLLNSIHPLYLRALLLTLTFCLGKYNMFALLHLVFLVNISNWYVKSSFMYVVLYTTVTVLNFTRSWISITWHSLNWWGKYLQIRFRRAMFLLSVFSSFDMMFPA